MSLCPTQQLYADGTSNIQLKCDKRIPVDAGEYSLVRNVQTASGPSICSGVKPPELEYDL